MYNYQSCLILNLLMKWLEDIMSKYKWQDHFKFMIPSTIGIILFMTPIKTPDGFTIPIALLANWIEVQLSAYLSFIMMLIIVITAILTVLIRLMRPDRLMSRPFINHLLNVSL